MARIKNLDSLKLGAIASEIVLGTLPEKIRVTDYVLEKGYKVNELVRKVHGTSYEWYGYLLAKREDPEVTVDMGIGKSENTSASTRIKEEDIAEFLQTVPAGYLINGWMHSHGNLNFRHFSGTDDTNMLTVLGFVSPLLQKPLLKREILIKDLSVLVDGKYDSEALKKGSVSVVLDGSVGPISKAKLYETIFGSFSYSIVVGDEKWHENHISYERRSLLTGDIRLSDRESKLEILASGRKLGAEDVKKLEQEVKDKIKSWSFTSGVGGNWHGYGSYLRETMGTIGEAIGFGIPHASDEVEDDGFERHRTSTGYVYTPKKGDKQKWKKIKKRNGKPIWPTPLPPAKSQPADEGAQIPSEDVTPNPNAGLFAPESYSPNKGTGKGNGNGHEKESDEDNGGKGEPWLD